MTAKMQAQVNEFRRTFGLRVSDRPRVLTREEAELHINLIRDEFEKELVPALLEGDLVETYDSGIDVLYYLIGLLSDAGMDIEPGFDEVQASNMSKLDPETGLPILSRGYDIDNEPVGKVLKGPDYFRPRLAAILDAQTVEAEVLDEAL